MVTEVQGKRNAARERQGSVPSSVSTPILLCWFPSGSFQSTSGDSARFSPGTHHVFTCCLGTSDTSNEEATSPVPLSALQRLSLANKSQTKPTSLASLAKGAHKPEAAGLTPPLSRLASLARTTPSPSPPATPSSASPARSTQNTSPKAPSKLASLAASRKAATTASSPVSSPVSPSLSKLSQRINANRQAASPPAASPSSAETTVTIDPLFLPPSKEVEMLKAKTPSAFGAVLASPSHLSRTQGHKNVTDIAVKKALGSNTFTFNTPSPDDIVLGARRGTSLASRVR